MNSISKIFTTFYCFRMAVGSVVLFFKQLSVEDVPYAFTYGDTVVAYTRFFMTDIENSEIPGAAEFVEKSISEYHCLV